MIFENPCFYLFIYFKFPWEGVVDGFMQNNNQSNWLCCCPYCIIFWFWMVIATLSIVFPIILLIFFQVLPLFLISRSERSWLYWKCMSINLESVLPRRKNIVLDVIRLYDDDEKKHCVSISLTNTLNSKKHCVYISLTNTLNIINFADGLSQIDRIRFIIDDDVDDYFYSSFLQVHTNFAVYFKILIFHFFRFFSPGSTQDYRHEMALDSYGRRLLVTSSSVRSPIYQVVITHSAFSLPLLFVYSFSLSLTFCWAIFQFNFFSMFFPEKWKVGNFMKNKNCTNSESCLFRQSTTTKMKNCEKGMLVINCITNFMAGLSNA